MDREAKAQTWPEATCALGPLPVSARVYHGPVWLQVIWEDALVLVFVTVILIIDVKP